jgi:hypothetical protein
MPQLDIGAFSSNLFWFFVIFALIYVVVLKGILPRLFKIFVFRANLTSTLLDTTFKYKLFNDYLASSFQYSEAVLFSLFNSLFFSVATNYIVSYANYNFSKTLIFIEADSCLIDSSISSLDF